MFRGEGREGRGEGRGVGVLRTVGVLKKGSGSVEERGEGMLGRESVEDRGSAEGRGCVED